MKAFTEHLKKDDETNDAPQRSKDHLRTMEDSENEETLESRGEIPAIKKNCFPPIPPSQSIALSLTCSCCGKPMECPEDYTQATLFQLETYDKIIPSRAPLPAAVAFVAKTLSNISGKKKIILSARRIPFRKKKSGNAGPVVKSSVGDLQISFDMHNGILLGESRDHKDFILRALSLLFPAHASAQGTHFGSIIIRRFLSRPRRGGVNKICLGYALGPEVEGGVRRLTVEEVQVTMIADRIMDEGVQGFDVEDSELAFE